MHNEWLLPTFAGQLPGVDDRLWTITTTPGKALSLLADAEHVYRGQLRLGCALQADGAVVVVGWPQSSAQAVDVVHLLLRYGDVATCAAHAVMGIEWLDENAGHVLAALAAGLEGVRDVLPTG